MEVIIIGGEVQAANKLGVVLYEYDATISVRQLSSPYKSRLMVKTGNLMQSLFIQDIQCFYSKDKITLLHTNNARFTIDYTLEELESMLDPILFFRVNRQCILHISAIIHVTETDDNRLHINIGELLNDEIAVSRRRAASFKKWLDC